MDLQWAWQSEASAEQALASPATQRAQVAAGCFIRAVNSWLPAGSQLLGLRVLVASVLVMSVAMFAAKAFIDARILVRPVRVVE